MGVTLDGTALASGVMGMDHCVRTMHRLTGVPLPEVVRMATLTPARILGVDARSAAWRPARRRTWSCWTRELNVQQVYVGGAKVV